MSDFTFAFLDVPAPEAGESGYKRMRELSLGFTRFKFSQPFIEGTDPAELLVRAAGAGSRFCVLMPYGCLLQERWTPGDCEHLGLVETFQSLHGRFELAGGETQDISGQVPFLVVDLDQYLQQGSPPFSTLMQTAAKQPLPQIISRNLVNLNNAAAAQWLGETEKLSDDLGKAVFVWNIEAYDDVEQPGASFEPPLRQLYTVAAGFKSNRILHSHGANPDTRMVVFDYSDKGLQFRRLLHEDWDGRDYPEFLVRLMKKLPASQAHYLLWQGADPENPDRELMEQRWQQELARWGGAEVFVDHWKMFRKMSPEYLRCDLLANNNRLLEAIVDDVGTVIWWSNAFLTINSIWRYTAARRQEMFRNWINSLALRAPRLNIIGADCNNLAISGITARAYDNWLSQACTDPLDIFHPQAPGLTQLRF